jgi:hypothetical protein
MSNVKQNTMKNMKNTENQTVSNAELKRIKDAKDRFTSHLNRNLKDFKNLYLKECIQFMMKMEEMSIQRSIKKIQDAEISYKSGWNSQEDKDKHIKLIESRRRPEMLQTLEFINDADKSFNQKIESMVCKMIEAKIHPIHFKMEKISGGTPYQFEFLISDDNIELHARTIFACGEIKAPHFRFITTIRNK